MRCHRFLLVATCFLFGGATAAAQVPDGAAKLAGEIDRQLARRWVEAKVEPAPRSSDAEFLRRVYLDLAGRIPSVAETRSFLADVQADRRQRLIERLLASPRYAVHFAAVYRTLLIPEAGNNFLVRFQQGNFEDWLKQRLASNAGYDDLARRILTAKIDPGAGFGGLGFGGEPSPLAFYSAKEYKPENLAAGAARVFLGVRVECAQCHNHPFADWKREQFWSFAAFFSGIESQQAGDVIVPKQDVTDKKELTVPGTQTVVQARFLDGSQPKLGKSVATRGVLADWLVSGSNPYFARAAVNRTWAYFFGTGLVEPVDEMIGSGTTSSHPDLLNLLAREFAAHHFDLKYLIRAVTLSEAYQRTSAGTDQGQGAPALFARMPLRGLTPEQLFDSLALATGIRDGLDAKEGLLESLTGKPSLRAQMLTKFANTSERATLAQTSILQALTLMNGKLVADATSLERSETLAALLDAPFLDTADRIETLYLAALSRPPTARERDRMLAFVNESMRAAKDDRERTTAYGHAVADVFWALLNSSEFSLNH
jgi:hypothetical protein